MTAAAVPVRHITPPVLVNGAPKAGLVAVEHWSAVKPAVWQSPGPPSLYESPYEYQAPVTPATVPFMNPFASGMRTKPPVVPPVPVVPLSLLLPEELQARLAVAKI